MILVLVAVARSTKTAMAKIPDNNSHNKNAAANCGIFISTYAKDYTLFNSLLLLSIPAISFTIQTNELSHVIVLRHLHGLKATNESATD